MSQQGWPTHEADPWAPPPPGSGPAAGVPAPPYGYPGAFPPPPPYGYAAWPPTPASRPTWRLWVALGVAALVLVGGCAAVAVRAVSGPIAEMFRSVMAAQDAAALFLDAAELGDTAAALSHACPGMTAADVPEISSYSIDGTHVDSLNGRSSAEVTALVTLPDGTSQHEVLRVEKHQGSWLVCSVQPEG